MAAANDADGGNVETAIGVAMVGGKRQVVLKYFRPVTEIVFDPQNAFEFAEGMARASYEARFGKPPPGDAFAGELSRQVKNRATNEMRNVMVQKQTFNIRSMIQQGKAPDVIARNVVDTLLADLT